MNLDDIRDVLTKQDGLVKTLGIELIEEGEVLSASLVLDERHGAAPGVAHGGSVMSLMDTALGYLALGIAVSRGQLVSTVEMKVNFLRPARLGHRLVVHTEAQSEGRSLLVLSGVAVDEESGERVAFAVGTFNLYDPTRREGWPPRA